MDGSRVLFGLKGQSYNTIIGIYLFWELHGSICKRKHEDEFIAKLD